MVKKGKIQLHDPGSLPEGVEVEVRIVKRKVPVRVLQRKRSTRSRKKERPLTLAERLSGVIGRAEGLAPDAAINHDHYLYGVPKVR